MRLLILIFSLWALAYAKPEMYKEKEDFQFSRSSSDDGTKAGYYGAQRGNMGGNYERAHNMDALAQHQMSTLVRQVDGELGEGANTRTGSVYTAGNSRGIYGSGNYDLSNLKGRNFEEGASYDDSQSAFSSQSSGYSGSSYSAADNARYSANQLRALGLNSAYLKTGLASQYGAIDNQQAENQYSGNSNYEYGSQGASKYRFYTHGGSQSRSQYDQSNANLHTLNNYDDSSKSKLITTPVKFYIRPGTRITIPVAAQTYDASKYALVRDQNTVNTEAEILNNSGQRINVIKPVSNAKHYENSYSYRKEWEKHDTQPVAVIPTDNPFPQNSELFEDSQLSQVVGQQHQSEVESTNVQSSNINSAYSSQVNRGYSANTKSAAASRLQYQSQQESSGTNAASNAYTYDTHNTGATANLNNLVENINSRPKSYQSSYSYHKSWERRGDPYIIQPAGGDASGQISQKLLAATTDQNMYYGNQYGQASCDLQCHLRKRRSYNMEQYPPYMYQEEFSQQHQSGLEAVGQESQSPLDNLEYLGQETQNTWDNLESLDQHPQSDIETIGQESQSPLENLENLGQQTQNTWNNLESLNQHTQSDIEALGQESQSPLDNLEDLGQQTQNTWSNLESLNQHTQSGNEEIGQQSQSQLDNLEDLGQQTQNTWNNLEGLNKNPQSDIQESGQQSETQLDNLENFGQQTQNLWDMLEKLGQEQTQTKWDKEETPQTQNTDQKTFNTWNGLEDESRKQEDQTQRHNTENLNSPNYEDNIDPTMFHYMQPEYNVWHKLYNTEFQQNMEKYNEHSNDQHISFNQNHNYMHIGQGQNNWNQFIETYDENNSDPRDHIFQAHYPNQSTDEKTPMTSNTEKSLWDAIDEIISESDKKTENVNNEQYLGSNTSNQKWEENHSASNNYDSAFNFYQKHDFETSKETLTEKSIVKSTESNKNIEIELFDHTATMSTTEKIRTTEKPKDIITHQINSPNDIGRGDIGPEEIPIIPLDTKDQSNDKKVEETLNTNKFYKTEDEIESLGLTHINKDQLHQEPVNDELLNVMGLEQQVETTSSSTIKPRVNDYNTHNVFLTHYDDKQYQISSYNNPSILEVKPNYADGQNTEVQIPENIEQQNFEQTSVDLEQQISNMQELTDFGQQVQVPFNENEQQQFNSQQHLGYLNKDLQSDDELSQKQGFDDHDNKDYLNEKEEIRTVNNKVQTVPKNEDVVVEPVEPSEKPGFWGSIWKKTVSAKDKVVSWFKN